MELGDGEWGGEEREEVLRSCTKAKGRWPLRASGMPTTLASEMSGWERMACSIAPGFLSYQTSVLEEE